jgi:hypothetical protein
MFITGLYASLAISCLWFCVYTFCTKAIYDSLPLKTILLLFFSMGMALLSLFLFALRLMGKI